MGDVSGIKRAKVSQATAHRGETLPVIHKKSVKALFKEERKD